jgi:NhaC family Na+:H+ antiporter
LAKPKKPGLLLALIPIICVAVFLYVGIVRLGADAQIPLIAAAIIATLIGMLLGYTWKDMEESVIKSISMALQACVILMIIGALIGSWIAGGIVPTMIYYGLQILKPSYFLPAVCLIGSIVSLSTGSSWTTAGTVGIAALGVGMGLGIPEYVTAGAVISGAYFGDKMSPLSDTTNLAPAMAGSNLFEHVRHMIYTTGPSLIIALILYFIVGLRYAGGQLDYTQINEILEVLQEHFWISPLMFIAPLLVIAMVVFKIPAIPGLIGGTLLGVFFAFLQGYSLGEVVDIVHYGFSIETQNPMVNELLSRGGLDGMMWTISLIIIALAFGGILERTKCLEVIVEAITRFAKTRGMVVLSNIITCIIVNFIAADQYIAIVLPGRMYKPLYEKLKLHPKNLSRVLEDAGTLTSPLVPWNTCGAFMWSTLAVHPFAYLPYAFLNLINPLVSAFYGFTGLTMEYADNEVDVMEGDSSSVNA